MGNLHRIQWIDQQIREGNYPNSTSIAQQFEISKRQAQRDIEYMGTSLYAPLLYVAKFRGYCYEDKTYTLPLVYMTEEEKRVLKYLAHRYRHYDYENAQSIKRVAHLLDRFTGEQEPDLYKRLPTFKASPQLIENIELLTTAIQESLVTHIIYGDNGGEKSFQICPLKLISRYNADYLIAYCEQLERQCSFRLDSIRHTKVTDAHFERTIDTEDLAGANRAPFPSFKPFVAKVRVLNPIHGDTWRGYKIRAKDGLVYDVEFYDPETFQLHLLNSEWRELLSPKWLKKKLYMMCEQTITRLGSHNKD